MRIEKTFIADLLVVTTSKFIDERGFFQVQYAHNNYINKIKNQKFVQDNLTYSKKHVLRGLHFQIKKPQAKLISVINGEIFDVAVDLRKNSKTYLKYFSINLSDTNNKQLFIPEGFAHGFYVLSNDAHVNYKCSDYYDKDDQGGIIWDDKILSINWPLNSNNPILSDKDKKLKEFKS